jgi:hypothetical protein
MRRVAPPTILSALLVGICAGYAQTPTWTFPPDSARCPSKWGAGDERGAANHMGPKSVLNAVKAIKSGEVIELGHPLIQKSRSERGTSNSIPSLTLHLSAPTTSATTKNWWSLKWARSGLTLTD